MYTATFTFAKKQFDERFQRLDDEIARIARATPGYLGEEAWESPATGLTSTVYYWDSLEALAVLMHHPVHLEAKASQADWLAGYRVVISQVIRSYGDDRLEPLSAERNRSE
jgi:heme-degrading monooxygenase HmoA